MVEGCSCGRRCSDCPYEDICGGCIEERCVHAKECARKQASCLFSDLHGLSCSHNMELPTDYELAPPSMLEEMVNEFQYCSIDIEPRDRHFPLLIPEVSNISPTTARLGVLPDDGRWTNPFFDMIAWDTTGNLFDKPKGAPWVSEPDNCGPYDWEEILGEEENWIQDILFVDRLPDRIALSTPPTSSMVLLLNRLQTYYPTLFSDSEAPYPWLVTHGYPSYVNWPPAWHFNLGIRMLSSLLAYIINQEEENINVEPGALYADGSRRTTQHLPLPYVIEPNGKQLLWNPDHKTRKYTEMEWPRFPGIVPFIPGADTTQMSWFGKMMMKAGFSNLAIDAFNSIGHENFNGINSGVQALKELGAKNVLFYGPWPLHIPSTKRPTHGISYIGSASHVDLSNHPPRYWRKAREQKSDEEWKNIPLYKTINLSEAASKDWIQVCDCDACQFALVGETDPRSIWRFGHFLHATIDWIIKVQDSPEHEFRDSYESKCLWFQGPSYTSFRQCLNYPDNLRCEEHNGIIKSIKVGPTRISLALKGFSEAKVNHIRWGTQEHLYKWADEFPFLEE